MGDSRGNWDGDTLVVDVADKNNKTWFDMAGDFHSDALHVVERYRMTGRDTIQYEATIEDSKVFTKPWSISIALHRRTDRDRLFEYNCEAEAEEANGAFERERENLVSRRWDPSGCDRRTAVALATGITVADIRRMPDGKPDCRASIHPLRVARTTA